MPSSLRQGSRRARRSAAAASAYRPRRSAGPPSPPSTPTTPPACPWPETTKRATPKATSLAAWRRRPAWRPRTAPRAARSCWSRTPRPAWRWWPPCSASPCGRWSLRAPRPSTSCGGVVVRRHVLLASGASFQRASNIGVDRRRGLGGGAAGGGGAPAAGVGQHGHGAVGLRGQARRLRSVGVDGGGADAETVNF